MDKQELAEYFDTFANNILIQGYVHGEPNSLHPDLEASNNFGAPNKSIDEAVAFQEKCRENGLNRFLMVRDNYSPSGSLIRDLPNIFTHKIYDYMKDYLGIQWDIDGERISTSSSITNAAAA